MAEPVALSHPKTGGEFEAHPEAVDGWKARGWEVITDQVDVTEDEADNEEEQPHG